MWEKLKELGMSRMGVILLAGVLLFILSHFQKLCIANCSGEGGMCL